MKAISVADPEPQSPLFAIIPQRNLLANDIKATAIYGCREPMAPLRFSGWARNRANRTFAATEHRAEGALLLGSRAGKYFPAS